MAVQWKDDGARRGTNPVYRDIGARLRLARKAAKVSQQRLADALGVSFQQVQKYEKGASPIGAARLLDAATVLKIPVSFFYPEDDPDAAGLTKMLSTPESIEINSAFWTIDDPDVRRRILDLVNSLTPDPRGKPQARGRRTRSNSSDGVKRGASFRSSSGRRILAASRRAPPRTTAGDLAP